MKPTETLEHEHDVIKRAINILETVDRRFEAGDDTVAGVYPQLVDFIREFADVCHHGKEEDILFRLLEERGMPRLTSPIGIMLIEHDHGRAFVKNLSAAADRFIEGDTSARAEVTRNAEGYATLLKAHIDKEDGILYPMANSLLSEADQVVLTARFESVEEELGRERHHRYEHLIDDLEEKFCFKA